MGRPKLLRQKNRKIAGVSQRHFNRLKKKANASSFLNIAQTASIMESQASTSLEYLPPSESPRIAQPLSPLQSIEVLDCEQFSQSSSDCLDHEEEPNEKISFRDNLACLISTNNCTRAFTDRLLHLIKREYKDKNLPKTKKALLQTGNKRIITRVVEPGNYFHVGIENTLIQFDSDSFLTEMESVNLYIGIDGCPMTSNRTSAWPILGSFPSQKEISPF